MSRYSLSCSSCGAPIGSLQIRPGLGAAITELMLAEAKEALDDVPGSRPIVRMILRKVQKFIGARGSLDMQLILPAFGVLVSLKCPSCSLELEGTTIATGREMVTPEIWARLEALNRELDSHAGTGSNDAGEPGARASA